MTRETVGFIGLGIMGRPMATHLLQAGHKMVVYNRTPSKMKPLVALGAAAGMSCQDVAQRGEVGFPWSATRPTWSAYTWARQVC